MHYIEVGDGPVVLFVHGVGSSGSFWSEVVDRLDHDHRCVVVDLDGFGQSPPLPGSPSVTGWAGSLGTVIGELGPEPPVIVDHSLGGMVAQELVLAAPGSVRAVVLCNTMPGATDRVREVNETLAQVAERKGSAALGRMMAPGLFGPEDLEAGGRARRQFLADCGATDPATLAAALRAIGRFDARDRLDRIALPVLVVAGEHEGNLEVQRALAAAVPDSRFEVVAGVGHMAPAEAPTAFSTSLRAFLTSPSPDPNRSRSTEPG